MKIIRRTSDLQTIEESPVPIAAFAVQHDLTMIYTHHDGWISARFEGVEVKVGAMLHGNFGRGRTEQDALADYCISISHKHLVSEGFNSSLRKEFKSPKLTP